MQLDIYEQGWIFPGNTSYNDGKGAVSVDLLVQTINAAVATEFKWLQHDLIIYEDLTILDGATPLVEDVDYIKGSENHEVSAFIAAYRSLPTTSIHVVTGIYIQDTGHLGNDLTVSGKYAGDEISMRDIPNILAKTTVYNITTADNEIHALPDARLVDNQHIVKRRGAGNGIVTFTTENSQTIDTLAPTELTLEGESSIILIPKDGNWESVKTGGAVSQVTGFLGETITVNTLVYFSSNGKLLIGEKSELSKSILAGFLTKDGILDDKRNVQSSGILDGFTGLVEGTQYFAGDAGGIVVKGAIEYNDYIVSVGVAVSTTELDVSIRLPEPTRNQDDGNPVGSIKYFGTYKDRSAYGYLPFAFDNAISQANYPVLFAEIDHLYNAQHVAAGDTDVTILDTLFYPTPVPGAYDRAGVPDSEIINSTDDIDLATDTIDLSEANYNALKELKVGLATAKNGVPIQLKLITGSLPTGLTEATTYYIRFVDDVNFRIRLYTLESEAITPGTQVSIAVAVGTFRLTQEGIVLDDAMQGHWHGLNQRSNVTVTGSTACAVAGDGSEDTGDPSPDGINGTPRTTNETRPKTNYSFGYIKVEHVTSAGEPISALRYDTGWIDSANDWEAKSFTITHGLDAHADELIIDIFYKSGAGDITKQDLNIHDSAFSGDFFIGLTEIDSNSLKLETGADGFLKIGTAGAVSLVDNSDAGDYKVVVTKPNLINTVFDVSNLPKTIDLDAATGGDYTFTLPAITGALQTREFFWKGGDGTYEFNFTTGTDLGDIDAALWKGEGDGHIKITTDGTGWQVSEYEDSGSNANGVWNKELGGSLTCKVRLTADGVGFTTWTFPTTFIDTTIYLSGNAYGLGSVASRTIVFQSGLTVTATGFASASGSDASIASNVILVATGRWRT